jgi:hypothetical protein
MVINVIWTDLSSLEKSGQIMLTSKFDVNCVERFSSYRAVNTLILGYKNPVS